MKSIYTIIITMYSTHTISEFFLGGMLKNLKEGGGCTLPAKFTSVLNSNQSHVTASVGLESSQ